ncbi:MAG: hypothetical protein LAQ30_29465 [Acidobacteriia bacterium]|nr:hypothetical protein [Terriglobia bacterium]
MPDGRAWPAFGDSASGYVLDFEGACSFLISERGASIDATPYADVPADLIQRLFLDQVIPLLVHLSGRECLHASAVLGPTGAYAFLGPSGAGKSTLAAALALRGCALLCDDCLALVERPPRGIFVLPGHRGSRLWPDSAEALSAGRALHALAGHPSKRALAAGQEPRAEAPLRGIYILEPAPSAAPLEIVPAGPQQVVPALLESSFRLDLRNSELLSRQFRFLMRLAASVPIRLLRYPHSFPALPALCRRILADAAERCPSSC